MPQQLDLCDPYLASCADYEVLEISGSQILRNKSLEASAFEATRQVDRTSDYLSAVEQARTHCLLSGKEVWVVDRNDSGYIVFGVTPSEYTARELRARPGARLSLVTN